MAIYDINVKFYVIIVLFFSYIYDAIRRGYLEGKNELLIKFYEQLNQKKHYKSYIKSYESPCMRRSSHPNKSEEPYNYSLGRLINRVNLSRIEEEELNVNSSSDQFEGPAEERSKSSFADQAFDQSLIDDCPLGKMPALLRVYQILSTIYIFYAFIRYGLICVIQYKMINVDRIYTCYLPGRLSFLIDVSFELPGISFIIIMYHVIYRVMLYCKPLNRLNLDCFIFIIFGEHQVRLKEIIPVELNTNSIADQMICFENYLFYQRILLENGETKYMIRPNRSLTSYLKLKHFTKVLVVCCLGNFFVLGIPITIIILYNLLSNEYFDRNYLFCRSFAGRPIGDDFQWTFADPFRFRMFFLDILDNGVLLIDTACAMTWPFTTAVICSHDLSIGIEEIRDRLTELKTRIIANHHMREDANKLADNYKRSPRERKEAAKKRSRFLKQLETDIKMVQLDIVTTFDQVEKVDKFMSKFSAFCIFCWLVVNLAYQLITIMRKELVMKNYTVIFLQVLGFNALTLTFAYLGRTHTLTLKMYHQLCSVMAFDPNFETTKPSWIWLLEYYHEMYSRHSLHLGVAQPLSMINYIKSMAWMISGAFMLISLLHHKLEEGQTIANGAH